MPLIEIKRLVPKIKKLNVPQIGVDSGKIRPFFLKIKTFFQDKVFKIFKSPVFNIVLSSLVLAVAIIQVAFSVMVYKVKAEDKVTRNVAKVIPFPASLVNYDSITYDQYLDEKDYIHHFYQSTKQEDVDLAEIDKQVLNNSRRIN
jgi:hypothetical protein